MNKIIAKTKANTRTSDINIGIIAAPAAVLLLLLLVSFAGAETFAPISNQLDVGATGNEVIKLQTFLASNHDFYPAGIVSGYYGNLTRNAVKQFQLYYGIPMVGRVGPMTLARMNQIMAAGYGIDVYAPTISNVSVQKNSTGATISWTTSESARGKVFYSTTPFVLREAESTFGEPAIIGGLTMSVGMQSSQNAVIQGLQPNTLYYYIVEAIDASGNISVTQQASFTTN